MKSVGRGMAIQQMCQPIINLTDHLQNTALVSIIAFTININ